MPVLQDTTELSSEINKWSDFDWNGRSDLCLLADAAMVRCVCPRMHFALLLPLPQTIVPLRLALCAAASLEHASHCDGKRSSAPTIAADRSA